MAEKEGLAYRFGEFVLDTSACMLRSHGQSVHLSPKALELLVLLIERRPRAVSKAEIHDCIWPETYVVEGNLPVLIGEIRRAIGDAAHEVVRTVYRRGYAFEGAVQVASPTESTHPMSGVGHFLVMGDRLYELVPGENVVGRTPDADVTFPFATVSRQHALVRIDGDEATLVDLGSKNGTRVDGHEVDGPTLLQNGAEIHFGRVAATYHFTALDDDTSTYSDAPDKN